MSINDAMFRFRVIIEWEPKYEVFVARCLETGSVVTADDTDTAEDMIKELLIDEVHFAIQHKSIASLLGTPLPLDTWARYLQAVHDGNAVKSYDGSMAFIELVNIPRT
jgi:hypothetical protein